MKNLSEIRKEREDTLTLLTVGDLLEPAFAKARTTAIAWALEVLDGEKDAIVRG